MLNSERIVPSNLKEPFYLEHIQRYKFALPFCKGKKVLDLGCGVGYGSSYLAKRGVSRVDAVDIDSKAIKYARRKYMHKGIKYYISNAEKLRFDNQTYDCVVSFEVIENIKAYKKYLREVKRVLKKDGVFILSTPNILGHRGSTSPYHFKEFSPKELMSALEKSGFNAGSFGQFFEDKNYVKSETEYFKRYKFFTINGNKLIKRIFHLIPSGVKTALYKLIWNPLPHSPRNRIIIKKNNFAKSTTLIAVCAPK